MSFQVIVLNDGETFYPVSGCRILDIPDDVEDVDTYVKEHYSGGIDIEDRDCDVGFISREDIRTVMQRSLQNRMKQGRS